MLAELGGDGTGAADGRVAGDADSHRRNAWWPGVHGSSVASSSSMNERPVPAEDADEGETALLERAAGEEGITRSSQSCRCGSGPAA